MSSELDPVLFRPAGISSHDNLGAGDVHVWYARTDRIPAIGFDRLADVLSPEERTRAAEYMQEKDRRTSIVARGLLRTLLNQYTGLAPESIQFGLAGNGKPVLTAVDQERAADSIYFNVSHSGRGVLLGFTRVADIGVDIEDIDRSMDDLPGIAENFFAPGEADTLKRMDQSQLRRSFFNCWTRKEAFIKVYGEGLSRDLNSFEVEFRPDRPARLLVLDGSEADARRFSMIAVDPEPDYIAAICLPARPNVVQGFAWDGAFL